MPRNRTRPKANAGTWIYAPEGFDPAAYTGPIAKHPDAARWFLNCIYFRHASRGVDKCDYVPLHSNHLAEMLGSIKLVKPIRDALENAGLIEVQDSYSVGRFSMGFRLGPKLIDARWKRYDCLGKRMIKRFDKFRESVNEPTGFTQPVHEHLARWSRGVGIDHERAVAAIAGMAEARTREAATFQLESIEQGLWHATVCKFGRFHTNHTNLCRELRACLTHQGEPLVELDVVNSQPFIMASLVMDARGKWAGEEQGGGGEGGTEGVHTICLPFEDQIPEDLTRLMDDVTDGVFYERIAAELKLDVDRDTLKRRAFQAIYGKSFLMDVTPIGQAFRCLYPTACVVLERIKFNRGFRHVAQEMQRRESALIIGGVAEKLRAAHSGVPVVTVHDSFLTTAEHLTLVEGLMRDAFGRFPRQPRFRVKGLGVPQDGPKRVAA